MSKFFPDDIPDFSKKSDNEDVDSKKSRFFIEGRPDIPKSFGERDFDAKHMREIRAIKYRNRKIFHTLLPWLIGFIVFFLVFIFLVVLPMPQIPIPSERVRAWSDYYFIALGNTGATALITFLTIVVSALLKQLYNYIRNYSEQ